MLSRVADALFWMARYVERAEHVARLLEVGFHLDFDLYAIEGSQDLQWRSILEILRLPAPAAPDRPVSSVVAETLTFDLSNSASIMTCINRARNNARSIRGSLSSDVWRELNKLYWQLTDPEFRRGAMESPHALCQAVQTGAQMFQGVCDATLTHDEGWRFLQLGKYLERADHTLRIIENRYGLLTELSGDIEPSLANIHWTSVLRSCQAYQSYQRLYISRVEPERVVEFLVFNREFPYSVRFCLETADQNLAAISSGDAPGSESKLWRILGRALSDLRYSDPDEVFHSDLRAFLNATRERCVQASLAVREQYSLV
jgi:uncharacterized alpha-E superfamily protein